ncbi:hypothetical protein GM1_061_00070 [Gordonia malaquae NBRC 108250]|uniref:Uncharacterized protein n=1 Tax=Gordonia malaquae NBRC 108250 TaxID=1223542 RepID=M3V0M0_GORML|nr:hypothetical protein GM1_061_00070 [Gordonia malaquae NBRC 108250]
MFRADIITIAAPRAVMLCRTERWILQRIAVDKLRVAAVAGDLGISTRGNAVADNASRDASWQISSR